MPDKRDTFPIFRAQYGAYDRVVACRSEAEARRLLGTDDVHGYHDEALARKLRRRPGVVFRKPLGVKRRYEAWE